VKRRPGHVVGILHARGGSKRIPLKNIAPVGGRPLIAWMIEAALASRRLERVIVSTDHRDIARIARKYGAEVPFTRPARLAEDCPSEWVTQHAVRYLEEQEGYPVAVPVTLQPTTPFCSPRDIDACVALLLKSGADTVMTFRKIKERPEWMYGLKKNRAIKFLPMTYGGDVGISQNLPKLYLPDGAVFATSYACLMKKGLIVGGDVRGVVVPDERAVEIDEPIDLILARAVAAQARRRRRGWA
jgi:CMP-N-acetylneuraminic acid synthetase